MARIALIGDNSIEYINVLLHIWNNGDCAVLIDWRVPFRTTYEMMIEANVSKCYIERRIFSKISPEDYSQFQFEVYDNNTNTAKELPANIYEKFHENYSHDEAVVIYSSGTTGKSKGIVLSHYAINTNADAILDYMGLKYDDCIYIVKSLTHSSTLTGELLVALKSNTRLIITPPIVHPRIVFDNLKKFSVTTICLNPTLLQMYAEELHRNHYNLVKLKTIYVSGAILNDKVYNLAHDSFKKVEIYNVYGLTEAGPRVTAQRKYCCKSNSVGHPLKGVHILIVNENGEILPMRSNGIIQVKTPSRYLKYISGKEKHKSLYKDWLNTGDVGFLDENNELHIVERIDNLINIDSHKIYPSDVENRIVENTSISECTVLCINKNGFSLLGCLYVSNKPLQKGEIERLKSVLMLHEIPRYYVRTDGIPRGSNNKVSRKEACKLFLNYLNAEENCLSLRDLYRNEVLT